LIKKNQLQITYKLANILLGMLYLILRQVPTRQVKFSSGAAHQLRPLMEARGGLKLENLLEA